MKLKSIFKKKKDTSVSLSQGTAEQQAYTENDSIGETGNTKVSDAAIQGGRKEDQPQHVSDNGIMSSTTSQPESTTTSDETDATAAMFQKLKEECNEDTTKIQVVKLWEDISKQRRILQSAKSPPSNKDEEMKYQTALLTLSKRLDEYDLLREKQRVKLIVDRHAEENSYYTTDCPICLETICISSYNSLVTFPCCGGGMCWKCAQLQNNERRMKCCPLCRGNSSHKDNERLTEQRAEKGHPLYQLMVGRNYMNGTDGFPVNVEKGLELITLAAEQRHPTALFYMGLLHRDGVDQFVPKSETKAILYVKAAADLGYTAAMGELSKLYWGEDGGLGKNCEDVGVQDAVLYTTLAYSQSVAEFSAPIVGRAWDVKDGIWAYNMGLVFRNTACDLCQAVPDLDKTQLLYRATHYFEEAAEMGFEEAFYLLAANLLDLVIERGKTNSIVQSYAPRILFWCREAAKGTKSKSQAVKLIATMEELLTQNCALCRKSVDSTDVQFKRCSRCRSTWYCSKECQVKHWNVGHKSDCIKWNAGPGRRFDVTNMQHSNTLTIL